jgi:hypothetical protein
MTNISLDETEIEKMKNLCNFLLFDQHSYRVSYPRFEECIGPLSRSQDFQLKKVFMDICGKNKKYITFPRLVRAYIDYKYQSKEKGIDCKKFFAHIFNEVLVVIIN